MIDFKEIFNGHIDERDVVAARGVSFIICVNGFLDESSALISLYILTCPGDKSKMIRCASIG